MSKNTFGSTPVSPSTRPHFQCKLCSKSVWREGGIASAQKHTREEHPGESESFVMEARQPQVYWHKKRNYSQLGQGRQLDESRGGWVDIPGDAS